MSAPGARGGGCDSPPPSSSPPGFLLSLSVPPTAMQARTHTHTHARAHTHAVTTHTTAVSTTAALAFDVPSKTPNPTSQPRSWAILFQTHVTFLQMNLIRSSHLAQDVITGFFRAGPGGWCGLEDIIAVGPDFTLPKTARRHSSNGGGTQNGQEMLVRLATTTTTTTPTTYKTSAHWAPDSQGPKGEAGSRRLPTARPISARLGGRQALRLKCRRCSRPRAARTPRHRRSRFGGGRARSRIDS
jgi:hypothetical protein